MPSSSAKQAKFMRAISHSPAFAKKVGVAQSVGKDFEMADKKQGKFGSGGAAPKPTSSPSPKPKPTSAPGTDDPYEPMPPAWKPEKKKPLGKAGAAGYKSGGKVMKKRFDDGGEAKGGKMKKYAKGGSVSSRADGIAKKGRTDCKMPKMAKGGRAKKGC